MSIWPTSPRNAVTTPRGRRPRRLSRRRVLAAAVTTTVAFGLLSPSPAAAATPSLSLTPTTTAGSAAVSFNATVSGNGASDTAYLCFGDEAPVLCDASHAGTAVDLAAATAVGGATVNHSYAAEGTFQAVLYEVAPGANPGDPSTVTTAPASVKVTIDGTARLTATTSGLTATFDGTASTAAAADTWWACFGDKLACSATAPDAHGTVPAGGGAMQSVAHTYAAPGTYPASLTVNGTSTVGTASLPVAVNFPDPTAVLSSDGATGSGILPVKFDGSNSVVGAGDSWAFCYGDAASCTAAQPDASGQIRAAGQTVSLPATAHNYPPGKYTATLWVTNGTTTTSATVAITVTNPIAGPDSTCTLSGTTRTCDLYAKGNGSVTAGSTAIPFWGFTTSDVATPVLGGPELVATEGETLAFTVHNQLDPRAGNVSITAPALNASPDLTGVAPGASGSSGSFALTRPGTYIYEAGMTSGGARQVAMGLSGVLIVRPSVPVPASSARCAYDAAVNADCVTNRDPNNYFDREKLVVVNELDASYSADPFKSDTGDYHPTNYFIDGVAYGARKPALDPSDLAFDVAKNNVRFDAARGDTVLLRYADLGLREHSLNLVNLLQTETARDSNRLPGAQVQNTEFLNAGETADTFVTVPGDAVKGAQYPLLDAGFHLNNGAAGGIGGMYSSLDVINGVTAGDIGPVGSDASATPTFSAATPNVDNGQVPTVQVTGTFTAHATAAGPTPTVTRVQWALDGVPATGGLWQQTTAAPSPAGATTASFDLTISTDTLTALLGTEPDRIFGDHTIWLQAFDSNNKAGPAIGASFAMARRDAVISTLSIDPKVTNGTTRSTQGPVVSTKISAPSNGPVTQSVLDVNSTAGFPATCSMPGACVLTVGMTIASGPAQGDTEYGMFTYTGITPTSFTGVVADASVNTGNHTFTAGNTVALDVVPAGYIALNATATAALPGWVVQASQACVVYAAAETAPGSADQAECNTNGPNPAVTDLSLNAVDSLAAVNGFLPPPKLPSGVTDAGKFWVLVRAQESPDATTDCTTAGACRWSPWLYYEPDGTADSSTYQPLTVVKAGPTTAGVTVSPTPNNGFIPAAGNLGLFDSFNAHASASSPWADIALAETFLAPTTRPGGSPATPSPERCISVAPDTPAGCVVFGQGAEMTSSDGFWNNSHTKDVTAFLPLSELQGMPDGLVTVWVHAKDIAGNWGPFQAGELVLDKTAPSLDALTRKGTGTVKVTAHDVYGSATHNVSSGIAGAEWFVGTDPGPGNGKKAVLSPTTALSPPAQNTPAVQTFDITGLPTGKVSVRVLDAAGNWSAPMTVQV